jgi:eukaryotic-like serine/threonine-protein kinase
MLQNHNNDLPPEHIGKYTIKGVLGRGSMGIVYEGFDPFVQRPVAIKVASGDQPSPSGNAKFQRSFFVEAHAAGKLQHPHIVSVYDAGVEGYRNYIVMEYVHGQTLQEYLPENKRLPVEEVIDIVFKCCKALDYAHRKGVIHRDIKPANIMLGDDGVVKIMDFGIAQLETFDQTQNTQQVGMVGSPYYMSPEQITGEQVGTQSDLYSLGVVLFQLLTGRPPFTAENYHSLIYQIMHVDPPDVRKFRPELPESLALIIQRSMNRDLEQRFKSGQEMANALSSLFDELRYAGKQIEDVEKLEMLSRLAFFRNFERNTMIAIMQAATWLHFEVGDTIINEGDIDDTFYIIVTGTAEVTKRHKTIGWLYKGDCFGEIGFLTQQQRTATIMAQSSLTLMKLNATVMDQVAESGQLHFYKSFTEALIKRLSFTNQQLTEINNQSNEA